jgi:nucleotide-binding universal stress UspA family protein
MTPVAVAQKISAGPKIALKNILFLTDFSEPSEAALPFAAAVARHYGAKVYALNVVVPAAYVSTSPDLASTMIEAVEENAKLSMNRVQACFGGVDKESIIERGIDVWSAVEQAIQEHEVDLIVLGTHGRTGATKFLLGSVAEEIFRRSPVPAGVSIACCSPAISALLPRLLLLTLCRWRKKTARVSFFCT